MCRRVANPAELGTNQVIIYIWNIKQGVKHTIKENKSYYLTTEMEIVLLKEVECLTPILIQIR